MMPFDFSVDIMRRTIVNLEFVERHKRDAGPYEVTQLVNSFLGALAHPWERLKEELAVVPLGGGTGGAWPSGKMQRNTDGRPIHLGDLIRLMRNGVAHGNIQFLSGGRGQISALRIWNTDPAT